MTKRASAQEKLNRASASGAAASRARTEAALASATIQRATSGPGQLTPSDMLSLQQTIGNRAVSRLIARSESDQAAPIVQAKLTVGAVDDPYEREADQMASQVTRSGVAPAARQQDAASERDEEDEIKEEEEMLQTKPQSGPGREGGDLDASVSKAIEGAKGGGQPLPDALRTSMDSAFSADFGGVRVHSDSQSDALNQSLNARAFTTGSDIFFGGGEYNPASGAGKELIAHELTHTIQQGAAGVKRTAKPDKTIQRRFAPARAKGKAHLRAENAWDAHQGPAIARGTQLLVDTEDANAKQQVRKVGWNTTWRPALNVPPDHQGPVPDNRKGYIRSSKAQATGGTLEAIMRGRIQGYLQAAETRHATLAGQLDKAEHIQFLMEKAIRFDVWSGAGLEPFVSAFGAKEAKFARIQAGADYVADVVEHWRAWLHPENPDLVVLNDVSLVKSDLHERGLGVVKATFTKPVGALNAQFGPKTDVTAFIKPEDKSLEQNLLGDNPNSAVNRINRIVGLRGQTEKLQSIKMESTDDYGTLVEAAQGASAEAIHKLDPNDQAIGQSFHETLVFAYLAGIDDLHYKNVYWQNGAPTLIDADNVLSRNQMEGVDNGAIPQSGFSSNYNRVEAQKNKTALTTQDNSQINSKILDVMMNNPRKRRQIINVIKLAIQGHRGRVVPIRTNQWGLKLRSYPTHVNQAAFLAEMSTRQFLVRQSAIDGTGFDREIGPGLFGVVGANATAPLYARDLEQAQTRRDLDSGVIPFYDYEFDTGHVRHNGVTVYHGQTLDQAMDAMLTRFGG
jgi:hypothetical protein